MAVHACHKTKKTQKHKKHKKTRTKKKQKNKNKKKPKKQEQKKPKKQAHKIQLLFYKISAHHQERRCAKGTLASAYLSSSSCHTPFHSPSDKGRKQLQGSLFLESRTKDSGLYDRKDI